MSAVCKLLVLFIIIVDHCHSISDPNKCEIVLISEGAIRLEKTYDKSLLRLFDKCWILPTSEGQYTRLSFVSLNIAEDGGCGEANIKIKIEGEEDAIFCHSDKKRPITALKDVQIYYSRSKEVYNPFDYRYENYFTDHFKISFKTEDLLCIDKNPFRCSKTKCVKQSQVCDGIKDCTNGKDEEGCEKGIQMISGVDKSKQDTVSWLKNLKQSAGNWGTNTHRAITALYLAGETTFDESNQEVELMAKQLELMVALALLRNGTDHLSINELGMYLHALLVTCHNPRQFYGFDLVDLLEKQIASSSEGAYPVASLALCNAKAEMTDKQVQQLVQLLDSDSSHPFLPDVQAMAVMALNCIDARQNHLNVSGNITTTINHFKSLQLQDGSFGNIYTTALIIQALLSSGQEENKDWKLETAIQYLMNQQKSEDSSFGDFWASYLILPILNVKSLTDIANVNCSKQRKSREANSISDIEYKLGPKMHVQFSLYIGNELDVVHSLSMRVPLNITAFEIMKLATKVDPKYKYESRMMSGKVYVYSIAGITNDSEAGKFWMLYLSELQNNGTANPVLESADQVVIGDGAHMIMWYKAIHF